LYIRLLIADAVAFITFSTGVIRRMVIAVHEVGGVLDLRRTNMSVAI